MAVKATIEMQPTRLLYQQTALGTAKITNDLRTLLDNLNPENRAGAPTFLVTDLASGATTRHRTAYQPEQAHIRMKVAPGKTLEFKFSLTHTIDFPGPGSYDVVAEYTWEGGEVRSPALRVELLESRPRVIHAVTGKGGFAPLYEAAWLHQPDPAKPIYDLWLAEFLTLGKPRVETCMPLVQGVHELALPCMSVPPNEDAPAQYVAWIEGTELCYVLRNGHDVSPRARLKLHGAGYRIVPPVLLNLAKTGALEGADILLYREPAPNQAGEFRVCHIRPVGPPPDDDVLEITDPAFTWVETIYLTSRVRYTFALQDAHQPDRAVLKLSQWSTLNPPQPVRELAAFTGRSVAATALLAEPDKTAGVVLMDGGEPAAPSYMFQPWQFQPPDRFNQSKPIPVAWPEKKPIDMAIVRVATTGDPFALLRNKEGAWYLAKPDGSVTVMPKPAEQMKAPADILFRGGSDPAILFTKPGSGFRFAKPK